MSASVGISFGFGLLFVVLALPMMLRRVPPNRWYGLRVPATFADEWVWYEANAAAGRDMVAVGVLQMAVALLLPAIPAVPASARIPASLVILVVGSTAAAIVGWRRANRLLARRRGRG